MRGDTGGRSRSLGRVSLVQGQLSAAERSMDGQRIRNFDADEIVAFARAFELPVTFFFMPPVPWKDDLPIRLQTPDAARSALR